MNNSEFRKHAHELADWMADYIENIHHYPVKPDIKPGDIKSRLPSKASDTEESFENIFSDFKNIILPGMTHWQHPEFFAYFPTGASEPSILAEMLSSVLGAQCMIWLTSPSAEELEERMMEWLRDMIGLPDSFIGVIQDSSSSATLVSLLTARESKTDFQINKSGFTGKEKFRIYTSDQAHSSVDKDVRIAGFGSDNLIKIDSDDNFAMIPDKLEAAVKSDTEKGYSPFCVVSTIGTTSSTAIDPVYDISLICKKYKMWHHIDASYSGTALILPEYRWMSKGAELADSFVFNPHKWMFVNFDCSAYFVRDKKSLINTFSVTPEYLKTPEDKLVNNYRDWGIPLGRKFRALKLWFVIRNYGVKGLQEKIRNHISFGQWFKEQVISEKYFELMAPVPLNLVCFRINPGGVQDEDRLEIINSELLKSLNDSGKILLTHTKLNGKYVIRFVAGQNHVSHDNVKEGWNLIKQKADELLKQF